MRADLLFFRNLTLLSRLDSEYSMMLLSGFPNICSAPVDAIMINNQFNIRENASAGRCVRWARGRRIGRPSPPSLVEFLFKAKIFSFNTMVALTRF